MNFLKSKLYSLIGRMSDVDLEKSWEYLQTLYYDSFMLQAIQQSKKTHKPGDILTKEEAIQILYSDREDNQTKNHQ
ncbi:MAG: hypothetical protein F6K17_04015 [Okeania sp. SIO3C4]|nr:hypothetical protein [Okeania sp. SIO3B3]NER01859.1 hypothetical protein [Okeania sp. SIO3C4]